MKDFSALFVDRPILAAVLSIVIFVAGLIAIPLLPVTEYPDVVPPSVAVRAVYPGASPKVIAETVATPIEEALNGVENMIYMKSVAASDGVLSVTVTFKPDTDADLAQVQVQNRINQALARLPEDVRRLGVTTEKQSPNITMVVHLLSPSRKYDTLYLRNFATLRVKDELARIDGVGQAMIFGGGDYSMRIWLDPDQVAARAMTAGDIVRAIREQNVQVSAGAIGAPPQPGARDFTLSIHAEGRLVTEEEFGDIVLKTGTNSQITRLRDVARIELGASEYALRSLLNNQPAVAVVIFQAPGSNAIEISDNVRAKMVELERFFPEGLKWDVVYDPTVFVRDSIKAVITTLLEAVLLVVLVVILFLQTWRASIIPLLAVPVSIIGTYAVLLALGFSINTLTLFGMVLAIGIVVDDAIVVVENVERNIGNGLSPKAAAHQAMREVSGPIIAIALVLCAVFVPIAFLSGVTGQFYRQFAVTIAISTVISAVNSLTLSPALAAALLKAHGAPPDRPTRVLDALFGWVFRPFNRLFNGAAKAYAEGGPRALGRAPLMLTVYAFLVVATVVMFQMVPGGFIPTQDKLYLIGGVKLPEGASLDRTEVVVRKMSEMALATEGVIDAVAFPGLNALQFSNTPNIGTIFFCLDGFAKRGRPAPEIAEELMGKFSAIQEAFAFAFMPPPILGIGTGSGFSLYVQDRAGLGYGELQAGRDLAGRDTVRDPRYGFSDQLLPIQRAATERAHRSQQGQDPGRDDDGRVRDPAGLSRLGLCERLQPFRPHLSGLCPGRCAVSRRSRGRRPAAYPQSGRRDGADRECGEHRSELRSRSGHPLQRLSRRRSARPGRSERHVLDRGPCRHRGAGAASPARRHGPRLHRSQLPADSRRQRQSRGVPAVRTLGVPGAGRALRELDPAARGDPDRADVHALGALRGVVHRR